MMRRRLHYCALYGPATAGMAGQQNLSRPLRALLAHRFELIDVSPRSDAVTGFPSLLRVITTLQRLLLVRLFRPASGEVTLIDMVHSFAVLERNRAADRFVVLGHDSYALRCWRELKVTHGLMARFRLALAYAGWCYVEFLLRRLAWCSLFVSPLDRAHAARGSSSALCAIPVSSELRLAGEALRQRREGRAGRPLCVLVAVPVRNPAQNDIDRQLLATVLQQLNGSAEVTLWGQAAPCVAAALPQPAAVAVTEWVEDYANFLASFDLLIYPRMMGSGFHTKLAEALVLGVPCLCVDWIATPLRAAGYTGVTSFTDQASFADRVTECLVALQSETGLPVPQLPEQAAPEAALAPVIESCAAALRNP